MKSKRKKKNPSEEKQRNLLYAALTAAAGLGGGIALAAYLVSKDGEKAIDDAIDVIDDANLRLPQPAMKMVIPTTIDEFALIDEMICEIGAPLVEDAPPGATADEIIEDLQHRLGLELYPSFPWPPMSGDHPTVSQLWTELGLLSRRAVMTGTICDSNIPEDALEASVGSEPVA